MTTNYTPTREMDAGAVTASQWPAQGTAGTRTGTVTLDSRRASPQPILRTSTPTKVSAEYLSRDTLIERKFAALADEWHRETDHLSSPSRRVLHPAYHAILKMDLVAVPYILHDLRVRGGDWYAALRIITRTSPIPADAQGNVKRMKEAWFRWGNEKGYRF